MVEAFAIVALLVAAAALWLGYLIFVRFGRLLVRMDALETRLDGSVLASNGTIQAPSIEKSVDPGRAGATAPSFLLPRVGGGEGALEAYRGQPVLLVFSDPQCEPCKVLLPKLQALPQRDPQPTVLVVSRGSAEANRTLIAELDLTFPVLLQWGWEIAREYGMVAAPVGYLIGPDGTIQKPRALGVDAILALSAASAQQGAEREATQLHTQPTT